MSYEFSVIINMALKKDLIVNTNQCFSVDKPGVGNTSRPTFYPALKDSGLVDGV